MSPIKRGMGRAVRAPTSVQPVAFSSHAAEPGSTNDAFYLSTTLVITRASDFAMFSPLPCSVFGKGACTGLGLKVVPRFCEFCSCSCLPLLLQRYSVLAEFAALPCRPKIKSSRQLWEIVPRAFSPSLFDKGNCLSQETDCRKKLIFTSAKTRCQYRNHA